MSRTPDLSDIQGLRKFRDAAFYRMVLRAYTAERRAMLSTLHERGYAGAITIPDLSLLANCEREGHSITELARAAGVTRQAASQHVSVLEKAGYVDRVPDPDDNRAVLVRRTPEGDSLLTEAMRVSLELEDQHRDAMGEDSFEQLKVLLADLLKHVDPEGLLSES